MVDTLARMRIARIAISQIGVTEDTGQNDGIPARRYMRGKRQVPWCSYFAIWVLRQAGRKVPGNFWLLGSVTQLEHSAIKHGEFKPREDGATMGDVIFFGSRGDSDAGPGRHCGIVVGVDGNTIHTVEGNVSNGVRARQYAADNERITGYGFFPRAKD